MEKATKWLIGGLAAIVVFGGGYAYFEDKKAECEAAGGTWQGMFGPCQPVTPTSGATTGTSTTTTGTSGTTTTTTGTSTGTTTTTASPTLPTVSLCMGDEQNPTQNADGTWNFPFNGFSNVLYRADLACVNTGPCPGNTCINTRTGHYFGPSFWNSCVEQLIDEWYPGFLDQYPQGNPNGAKAWEVGMGGRTTAAGYQLSYSGNSILISYIPGRGYYSCGQKMPDVVAQALIG